MVDNKIVLCYGSYYMELSEEEIWLIYTTFTRMNAAFSAMKSPPSERPTFHQLQNHMKTHIFLCMLAVAIENTLLDRGDDTSRWILRQILKTHRVCRMLLPADNSYILNQNTFQCTNSSISLLELMIPRNFGPRLWAK